MWGEEGEQYPSGEACVRQTDAWCRPAGSPAGTQCAPAGPARQAGSGDSGCGGFGGGGGGGTGVRSGEGGHTQDLRNNSGNTYNIQLGFEAREHKDEGGATSVCGTTEGSSGKSGNDNENGTNAGSDS